MIGKGAFTKRHDHCRGRVLVARGVGVLVAILCSTLLSGCAAGRNEPLAPLLPLSAAPEVAGEELAPDYLLLPGDVVRVKFLYHPELDAKVQVRPDGMIALHGVGVIRAEGRTADELAEEIKRVSSERLRDPAVAVLVDDVSQHKVYVGGEVRNPGFVFYREGMTPLQAIIDRGGFTDVARVDSVLKISGAEATRLDFSKTLHEGTPEMSRLAANDVLYVPRTFVGDANAFVRLYFRNMVPVMPRIGVGFAP